MHISQLLDIHINAQLVLMCFKAASCFRHVKQLLDTVYNVLLQRKQRSVCICNYKMSKYEQHSHVPCGPEGSGYYTENGLVCLMYNKAGIPLVKQALGKEQPNRYQKLQTI